MQAGRSRAGSQIISKDIWIGRRYHESLRPLFTPTKSFSVPAVSPPPPVDGRDHRLPKTSGRPCILCIQAQEQLNGLKHRFGDLAVTLGPNVITEMRSNSRDGAANLGLAALH